MTNQRRYRFDASRYSCGCVYHTPSDIALKCPVHHGWLTGTEIIYQDSPEQPEIPGMVKNPHFSRIVQVGEN